jgi:hypothetical protein
MIAHYARKLGIEVALYNDERLWTQFKAAWMLTNRARAQRPAAAATGVSDQSAKATVVGNGDELIDAKAQKKAAGVGQRKQRAVDRKAEKKWMEEREHKARMAFKKAIAAEAEAALPAP